MGSNQRSEPRHEIWPDDVASYVNTFVQKSRPGKVLIIDKPRGPGARCTDELQSDTHSVCEPEDYLAQDGSRRTERADLTLVVAESLSDLAPRTCSQILATLRDAAIGAVVVIVDPHRAAMPHWQMTELISLGFRRCPDSRSLSVDWHIYYYDIRDYKITPDWLNKRHWSNPERWGKNRW